MIGVLNALQDRLERDGWEIECSPQGHPTMGYMLDLRRGGRPLGAIRGMLADRGIIAYAIAPDGRHVARKTFRVFDEYAENVGKRSQVIHYDRLYADVMEFIDSINNQGKE